MKLNKIKYEELNARQKENYNYHKVASRLADYGYDCMRLNNDWEYDMGEINAKEFSYI